jgi:putative aldouronate transport system substrate-binding protein
VFKNLLGGKIMVIKKHDNLKKIIALFISVTLLITIFSACTKSKTDESSKEEGTENKFDAPVVTDKVPDDYVLTITMPDRYSAWPQNETREIWKKLQDKTNIKFKFDCILSEQYNNSVQIMLASKQKLPDLLVIPGTQPDVLNYFKEGLIISLKDLIDKNSVYLKKLMKEKPDYKASIYTPEGDVPAVSGFTRDYLNFEPSWPWVRLGFLDNLGLKMPQTIDDFYNMLEKFKNEDTNKNGDPKDEIPFSVQSWSSLYRICQFFDARTEGDGFNQDANGEVKYHFITDEFKEAITFLNRLYKNELLDNEFSTMTSTKLRTKIANQQVCAFVGYAHGNPGLQEGGIKDDYFQYLPVLENFNGNRVWVGAVGMGGWPIGITKDCKYPEVAFKWIDECLFNKENYDMFTLGIEGVNYDMVDGKYTETDWYLNHPEKDTFSNITDAVRWLGGTPALPYPYDIDSYYIRGELAIKLGTIHKDQNKIAVENIEYAQNPFPYVYPDVADLEVFSRYMNDINTYRDEMVIKFIIGEEKIDNFDKYVKTLNEMGVKEILEIKKKQYEQYLKIIEG